MECRSCGIQILSSFKHALSKNECPSCGSSIMDEEFLALIEDVANTIRSEATVRDETANNLAMILVSKYDMNIKQGQQSQPVVNRAVRQPVKVAPPSTIQQEMKKQANIISPEVPAGISEEERERIFEEAVRKKYNMVDTMVDNDMEQEDLYDFQESKTPNASLFSEGAPNSIL
jgi:hypothetical protein